MAAAYEMAKRLGPGHTIATVICDNGLVRFGYLHLIRAPLHTYTHPVIIDSRIPHGRVSFAPEIRKPIVQQEVVGEQRCVRLLVVIAFTLLQLPAVGFLYSHPSQVSQASSLSLISLRCCGLRRPPAVCACSFPKQPHVSEGVSLF